MIAGIQSQMAGIKFTTTIRKFDARGEKSGWTYFEVPADLAEELCPGKRQSFRVKGKLDQLAIAAVALLPMGGGSFIMPLNAQMRKGLRKKAGAELKVELQLDKAAFIFNEAFMVCLADEPMAQAFFSSLPPSHQRYFSKWIDEAKTEATRVKRIAMAVSALARNMGFGEMIRFHKADRS